MCNICTSSNLRRFDSNFWNVQTMYRIDSFESLFLQRKKLLKLFFQHVRWRPLRTFFLSEKLIKNLTKYFSILNGIVLVFEQISATKTHLQIELNFQLKFRFNKFCSITVICYHLYILKSVKKNPWRSVTFSKVLELYNMLTLDENHHKGFLRREIFFLSEKLMKNLTKFSSRSNGMFLFLSKYLQPKHIYKSNTELSVKISV